MPRPTARVLALLEILQNGGTRPVSDLARRLEVDERTVRRYVGHLLDLDVPVESVRGRYGGYRLAPGYRLPPLMLTDDEAVAVLVGLLGLGAQDGPGPGVAAGSAAAKVRRVLPRPLAARVAAWSEVAGSTPRATPPEVPEARVLLLVAQAARDRRTVEIVHTSRDGRTTERVVEPYGVVAHAGRWYLTGLDRASGDHRTFRLDRVQTARAGSATFEVPPTTDPQAEVLRALATTPWRHLVRLRVRGDADAVAARLPLGVATVAPVVGRPGWVRVELRAEQLDWVPGLLAGLDADLVVEAPEELRDRVRALGERLLAAAAAASSEPEQGANVP